MELYDLLVRAKNHDEDAICEIINDFKPTLKKLSNSLYYEEAETDLIIELLKFIKNIDINKFKNSTHKQIAKYIHMLLRKRTIDLAKKNRNSLNMHIELNHEILIDETIDNMEDTILTSILLESLVKQQKDIIIMKFIYGFSESDIAKMLKVSRQAINKAKNRALKNLKEIWR